MGIKSELRKRQEMGIKTYGESLSTDTAIDARVYALEEALDLLIYLELLAMQKEGRQGDAFLSLNQRIDVGDLTFIQALTVEIIRELGVPNV